MDEADNLRENIPDVTTTAEIEENQSSRKRKISDTIDVSGEINQGNESSISEELTYLLVLLQGVGQRAHRTSLIFKFNI